MKRWLIVLTMLLISANTFADEPARLSVFARAQDSLSQTWASENYELYIPINTWHNRSYYSREKINSFNEQPWGLGIGKYRFDEEGDWHALYVMAFEDSHNYLEPIAGYGFQEMLRPFGDFHLGLGYTVGVTIRQDLHYVPIPVIAPLLSVSYKAMALQSTYIFGGNGNGNILFTWIRWQL